jgi:hypothetical protein
MDNIKRLVMLEDVPIDLNVSITENGDLVIQYWPKGFSTTKSSLDLVFFCFGDRLKQFNIIRLYHITAEVY